MAVSLPPARCFLMSIQNIGGVFGFSISAVVIWTLAEPAPVLNISFCATSLVRIVIISSSREGWCILSTLPSIRGSNSFLSKLR